MNEDVLQQNLFAPADDSAVFVCGPPTMIQKAVLPTLRTWGYKEDINLFGF